MRIEPPPSVACAIGRPRAATTAAEPPDEPPGERSLRQGLRVAPPKAGSVVGARPNSLVLLRPDDHQPGAPHTRHGRAVGCRDRLLGEEARTQGRWRAGAFGHELLHDEGDTLEWPLARGGDGSVEQRALVEIRDGVQ